MREARALRRGRCAREKRTDFWQRLLRANTKFVRYEFRLAAGSKNRFFLKQHGSTEQHRLACRLLTSAEGHLSFIPEVGPEAIALDSTSFAGRVPQPEHWKTAWAESTSVVSYLKQETLAKKKGESREGICIRKQRAKLVTIMSEVAKRKARKHLREQRLFVCRWTT